MKKIQLNKSIQIIAILLLVTFLVPSASFAKSTVDVKGYLYEEQSKEDIKEAKSQFSVSNVIKFSNLNEYGRATELVVQSPGKITLKDLPFLFEVYRLRKDSQDEYSFYYPAFSTGDSITLTEPGIYEVGFRYEAIAGMTYALIEVVDNDGVLEKDQGIMGKMSNSNILLDDEYLDLNGYNIQDNNYFKLRDLAKIFSGSEKQFDVTWNEEKKTIELLSGEEYTPVGEELGKSYFISTKVTPNKSKIYKDGKQVELVSYTIEGNNYFKLRDVADMFGIEVNWNEETQLIEM